MKMKISDAESLHESFIDHIEETTSPVTILGYEYNQAEALRKLDPIAYKQALFEWLDYQYTLLRDDD